MKNKLKINWFFPLLLFFILFEYGLFLLFRNSSIEWIKKINSFSGIGTIALPAFITIPEMRKQKIWKLTIFWLIFIGLAFYSFKTLEATVERYSTDYFQIFAALAGIEFYYVKESEGKKGMIDYMKYVAITFLLSALILTTFYYL